MAYTYQDFETAANSAGLMDQFSRDDLNIAQKNPEFGLSMVKLYQDAGRAATTEQKLLAQEAQNQLRKVYGGIPAASAETAGAQTTQGTAAVPGTVTTPGSTGSFTFGQQGKLDDLVNKVVQGSSFAYDPNNASAAAVRKQYLRQAERAREDTLAKAGAMSGGVASSYAVSAAQQAGDAHLAQLADKEMDLENMAYSRYLQDYQKQLQDLNVLTSQRDFDYTAYLNQVKKDREDLQTAMNLYNTYQGSMSIDAMREMFAGLGMTNPGIGKFLDNMAAVQAAVTDSGSYGGGGRPKNDVNQQLLNKVLEQQRIINGNQYKIDSFNQAAKQDTYTAADAMWDRNNKPHKGIVHQSTKAVDAAWYRNSRPQGKGTVSGKKKK